MKATADRPMPSIKADRWIKKMALEHGMIEPFEDRQVRDGRDLVRPVVVRLRHPRRRRVQGLHQHQQHRRRSEELRRALVRGRQGRRLHHPAELVRAGQDGRVLPDPARRADRLRRQVHLRPLRPDRERHAVRARVGRLRDARDLEHHAAAGEGLRQRGHLAGAVLPERRGLRGLLRGQEGQVPEAAGA